MAEPIKGCLHSLQRAINRDCLVYVLICDRRLVLDPVLCMHRHHHHYNGRTGHLGVLLGTWALQGQWTADSFCNDCMMLVCNIHAITAEWRMQAAAFHGIQYHCILARCILIVLLGDILMDTSLASRKRLFDGITWSIQLHSP